MFVSRRTTFGTHWMILSLKRFLFLFTILQVTTIYGSLANRTSVFETLCAKRWTCRSCTEITTPVCSWSVPEQMCANIMAAESRLVVTNGSSCPTFTVNNSDDGVANNQITVTVNDTDIGGSFVNLLANSHVKCRFDHETYEAMVFGDQIVCAGGPLTPKPKSGYRFGCRQFEPTISHLLIVFDDKPLRFDNVNNHYVATYPTVPGECSRVECSDCYLDNGTYRSYCWRCAEISYCDVRNISSFEHLSNVRVNKCSIGGPVEVKLSIEDVQSDQTLGFVSFPSNNGTKMDVRQTLAENDTHVDSMANKSQTLGGNGTKIGPTVDEGQVFDGIASGGTAFLVWGQRFSILKNTKACIIDSSHCGRCEVHNDTLMVCRSPVINTLKLIKMRFYELSSTGNFLKINNHSSSVRYQPYLDPVFTDFVVDGCCNVTVYGLNLDQGYGVKDLSIALVGNNSSSECQVTLIYSTQITCQLLLSSSLSDLPSKQVNVKVGESLRSVVKFTKQKFSHFKSSFQRVVTIIAYLLFIVVLCVAFVFKKSSKNYDLLYSQGRLQPTVMRPLGERNSNDCGDHCEYENMLMPLSIRDETHF